MRARRSPPPASAPAPRQRGVSHRGATLIGTPVTLAGAGTSRAFRPGMPAFDGFPFEEWSRYVARRWRNPATDLLGYGDAAGYRPLREAIARHLAVARGVRCDAGQVVIVAGSQQALDLAARVLLDPGDAVWIEEPGYLGARAALAAAGAKLVPVPVDAEGLDVAAGVALQRAAAMAYVSPSHQYPLGVTMSLSRRLALLEWARAAGAWVLEDDYDSEYRYAGRPLAALQGLDGDGRVIYLGTFSKVMLPSLRLGYLVLPPDLVDAFVAARAIADRHSPSVEQAALADFIVDGQLDRHIRRMRMLYAERQAALVDAAKRELAGVLDVPASDAGDAPGRLAAGRCGRRRSVGERRGERCRGSTALAVLHRRGGAPGAGAGVCRGARGRSAGGGAAAGRGTGRQGLASHARLRLHCPRCESPCRCSGSHETT